MIIPAGGLAVNAIVKVNPVFIGFGEDTRV